MEITINIEPNHYSQPTEIRQEVVQGICDAFLRRCMSSIFHPFNDRGPRNPTYYIWKWKGDEKFVGFECSREATGTFAKERKDVIRVHGAEMKLAFKTIIKAGYHIFKVYEYGTWMGYVASEKPFREGGCEVFEFNDFID